MVLGKKSEDEFKDFLTEMDMNWIQVLDGKEGKLMAKYKINRFPSLFLIDKNGIVITKDEGLAGVDLEKTLSEYLTN